MKIKKELKKLKIVSNKKLLIYNNTLTIFVIFV